MDRGAHLLVLRNVIALDTLTDGWVAAMRAPGYLSWIAAPAILLLYAYLIRFWVQCRHSVAATAN